MSHKRYVAIGLWIALLPFLGLPSFIKSILFVLTGLYLMFIGYKLYRKKEAEQEKTIRQTKTFSEIVPQKEEMAEAVLTEQN